MGRESSNGRSVLPEGVERREGARGSRLRVRFYYQGERRGETLDIPDTPANVKYAGRLVAEIKNAIERGTFDYAATFPNSKTAIAKLRQNKIKSYTVGDLVDSYINNARKTGSLSPSTLASYVRWNKSRISGQWGETPVVELSTLELRAWIADLSSELAPKSVRNCVGLLSVVLNQAHADGIVSSNPLTPIKLRTLLPRKRKSDDDIDPFNDAEIATLLAACPYPETRALFQFAFASGLRTGELIALKWGHIDRKRNSVRVEDNIILGESGTGTVKKSTKTDNVRDVPLLPAALEALEIMRPISFMVGEYVFTHPVYKKRWRDNHQIHDAWTWVIKKAGIRYRNPYQTRHTFASRLLMAGEQELLVAKLLGHATVEMVRRHYGRYIKQADGVVLRGDYSTFGAISPKSAPNSEEIKAS